jgi:multiple sugar transport system substrate-binding protein
MRRVFGLAAAVAFVVVSACGGGTGSTGGGATAPVTLSLWGMGDEGDKLPGSDVLRAFENANPGIKVNVTAIPWSVAHDKLVTAVAGRQTPDVSMMGTTWMGEFAKLNVLDQVPGSIDRSSFFPGAWDAVTAGGRPVGVPWYVDTRVLYFRTDLAQKVSPGQPPRTWDDLLQMAKAYKAGGSKYGISLASNDWQEWLPFLYSAGGDVMRNGKFTLDSPAAVRSLMEYATFFKQGLAPPSQPQGFDVIQTFASGDTPMFFSGPWQVSSIQKQPALQGKWSEVRVPMDASSTSFVGGGDLVVFKTGQHRDAAWKLVQFLAGRQQQVSWFKTISDLPAVRSAWQDQSLAGDENLKVFGQQLASAKAPPAISQWEELAQQLDDWLEKACAGTVSPADAAAGMQKAAMSLKSN